MINQQTLELYVYVDGINDIPFFSGTYEDFILTSGDLFTTSDDKTFSVRALNEDILIHNFTYTANRMGSAPVISATILYGECLDELFSEKVYAVFNGEKYFLLATPSSSYSSEDVMYKHEATFASERVALENTYFYDVVSEDYEGDKPVSNDSEFVLFGDIHYFAERMNFSLNYAGLDYTVEVDEGIESDEKMLSAENKFFSEVLQEVYNVYDIPYYFVGKTIHIGYTTNAIDEVFRYGDSDALVSISKNNANSRIINRATGIGSAQNIPYYYPNPTAKGTITVEASNNNTGITTDDLVITDAVQFANNIALDTAIKYTSLFDGLELVHTTRNNFNSSSNTFTVNVDIGTMSIGDYVDLPLSVQMLAYDSQWRDYPLDSSAKIKPVYSIEPLGWIDSSQEGTPNIEVSIGDAVMRKKNVHGGIIDYTNLPLVNDYYELPTFEKIRMREQSDGSFTTYYSYEIGSAITLKVQRGGRYEITVGWEYESNGYWVVKDKKIELSSIGIEVNGTPLNGDVFYQRVGEYITPQKNLMPPIYRESLGEERFYNAISNVYPIPDEQGQDSDLKYEFENEYNGHNPKEQIVQFEELKPTIKEMINSEGLRIDMFSDIAFDDNDNDETYETEEGTIEYRHPLFFAKLRKLDFNLFDHALDGNEMTITMTDGECGGCEFKIAVDETSKKNTVQVDENGDLIRDDEGNVLCGRPTQSKVNEQDRQQDTINNEVWIALYKDKDTFGVIMPNATDNYRPAACSTTTTNDGDTFVILHISLPQQYILAAEEKLKQQILYFIYDNNSEKFNFSIKFSRIYFEEHPEILALLDENARINVEYNDKTYLLYVSSITYKTVEDEVLPEITVELKDEISVSKNAIQKASDQVKADLYGVLSSIDVVAQGNRAFLRKDQPDTASYPITFKSKPIFDEGATLNSSMQSNDYFEGIKGIAIRKDSDDAWHIETDYLHARRKFSAKEVEIQKVYHIGGAQIKSSASMVCTRVDDIGDAYRCYMDTVDENGETIYNQFVVGDQAYVQTFNLITDSDGNTTNHFYWRLVESVDDNSIVLSKTICASGSTAPMVGDHIVQLGYQGDDKPERQVAVIDAGAGEGAPYYRQYVGINSFALPEPETQLKPNDNILTGRVTIQAGSSGIENMAGWAELQNDLENIRNQIDGVVESYFYDYDPTLENYPANEWTTNELKDAHIGDTFTNTQIYVDDETTPNAGKSWRWLNKDGVYGWYRISDTDALKALALAQQAKDVADGKRRVFTETPYTPYDVGDLWAGGNNKPLMRCIFTRVSGDYVAADWDLADDSHSYAEKLINAMNSEKNKVWYNSDYPTSDPPTGDDINHGDIFIPWDAPNQMYIYDSEYGWQLASDTTQTVIDGGLITSGTIQLGDSSANAKAGITGGGTNDASVRIWAGAGKTQINNAPFRVLQDGTMYATKGMFNGQIDVADGVFSVDSEGKVVATNADISGKITSIDADISGKIQATEGQIAGFAIDRGYLTAPTDLGGETAFSFSSTLLQYTDTENNNSQIVLGKNVLDQQYTPLFINVTQQSSTPSVGAFIQATGSSGGNYALFIPKGVIGGLRTKMTRVNEDSQITIMDTFIVVFTAGVTLTLPSNAEDGQMYYIKNVTGSNITLKVADDSGQVINDGVDNSKTSHSWQNGEIWQLFYDAVNQVWYAGYSRTN